MKNNTSFTPVVKLLFKKVRLFNFTKVTEEAWKFAQPIYMTVLTVADLEKAFDPPPVGGD